MGDNFKIKYKYYFTIIYIIETIIMFVIPKEYITMCLLFSMIFIFGFIFIRSFYCIYFINKYIKKNYNDYYNKYAIRIGIKQLPTKYLYDKRIIEILDNNNMNWRKEFFYLSRYAIISIVPIIFWIIILFYRL